MKKVLQILLIILLVCQSSLLLITLIDNTIIINYLLSKTIGVQNPDMYNGLRSAATTIFGDNLHFLQVILVLLIVFFVWCIFKIELVYSNLSAFLSYLSRGIKEIFKNLKDPYILVLLFIPLFASVYFGIIMPVSYDEALTYVDFTHGPIAYCLSSYPLPNNHILHSIFTHITVHIPIGDLLFRIRISPIIFSLLTWIIAYSFVKRFYSRKTALLVTAISSVLFMSIYYSYMSRGYALVSLFFIISLFASFNIIKYGSRNKDWAIFSISSVLGFYAVPSFLYPFLTINLLIFVYNYKDIKQQVIFNLFVALFTLLLYFPIILHQGFEALTSPVKERLWVISYLPLFFKNTFNEIFGISIIFTVIPILFCFFIALKERVWPTIILWLLFGLSPIILLIGHSVIPFPRTFIYYGFFIIFLMGISLKKYIEMIPINLLVVSLFIIQIAFFVNFKTSINDYETFNIYYKDMNDRVIEKDAKGYVLSGLDCDTHEFEMISRGYDINNIKYEYLFIDFDNIRKVNIDTVSGVYDYIIIDIDKDVTVNKKPSYSNAYMNLYSN